MIIGSGIRLTFLIVAAIIIPNNTITEIYFFIFPPFKLASGTWERKKDGILCFRKLDSLKNRFHSGFRMSMKPHQNIKQDKCQKMSICCLIFQLSYCQSYGLIMNSFQNIEYFWNHFIGKQILKSGYFVSQYYHPPLWKIVPFSVTSCFRDNLNFLVYEINIETVFR